MSIVADFLRKSQVQYLATTGTDGTPKVRPFQFMLEKNGKLYFGTSNQKNVYREMDNSPFVEICASGENFSWMRLSGKVIFDDNKQIKSEILEISPLVKSIYKSPDNPVLEIFYLTEAKAVINDFSGNPPQTIELK